MLTKPNVRHCRRNCRGTRTVDFDAYTDAFVLVKTGRSFMEAGRLERFWSREEYLKGQLLTRYARYIVLGREEG